LRDLAIIAAFLLVDDTEIKAGWKPDLAFVDENNRIKGTRDHVPPQNRM
jgi:aspartate 1-decarboxylase